MSHDVVCSFHYRGISGVWLCSVTVWLFSREGVAKNLCKRGSGGGIYIEGVMLELGPISCGFNLHKYHLKRMVAQRAA